MYIGIYVYLHIYTRIYIHTHTHAHTHTYIYNDDTYDAQYWHTCITYTYIHALTLWASRRGAQGQ